MRLADEDWLGVVIVSIMIIIFVVNNREDLDDQKMKQDHIRRRLSTTKALVRC